MISPFAYEPKPENMKIMENGLVPQYLNREKLKTESVELHHEPPQRDGGLFDFKEVTIAQHRELDPQRANFINELKGDCKMTIERCPELKHTLGGEGLFIPDLPFLF